MLNKKSKSRTSEENVNAYNFKNNNIMPNNVDACEEKNNIFSEFESDRPEDIYENREDDESDYIKEKFFNEYNLNENDFKKFISENGVIAIYYLSEQLKSFYMYIKCGMSASDYIRCFTLTLETLFYVQKIRVMDFPIKVRILLQLPQEILTSEFKTDNETGRIIFENLHKNDIKSLTPLSNKSLLEKSETKSSSFLSLFKSIPKFLWNLTRKSQSTEADREISVITPILKHKEKYF